MKKSNWKKYSLEFLSIFVAVISAFALNNWNENKRDRYAESKIITEIAHGLKKDIDDIKLNKGGHESGIKSCVFWRKIANNKEVNLDSMTQYYFDLTRDYISIQNVSGYEALKSQGLELIENDSLRAAIVSIYEYEYNTLRKFEEEYSELQFQQSYFKEINHYLAPHFVFDEKGNMISINLPLNLSESERKTLLTYLWKIQANRNIMLFFYTDVENKINLVLDRIENH